LSIPKSGFNCKVFHRSPSLEWDTPRPSRRPAHHSRPDPKITLAHWAEYLLSHREISAEFWTFPYFIVINKGDFTMRVKGVSP